MFFSDNQPAAQDARAVPETSAALLTPPPLALSSRLQEKPFLSYTVGCKPGFSAPCTFHVEQIILGTIYRRLEGIAEGDVYSRHTFSHQGGRVGEIEPTRTLG